MRTRKPARFVTYISVMALLLAFLAPTPASAQTVDANICAAVDLDGDGLVVQADIDAAVSLNPLLAPQILANALLILGGGCAVDTTGGTTGDTAGNTTDGTAGATAGNTTDGTAGATAGNTTDGTAGVTSGNTTAGTVGVTSGTTTDGTAGATAGTTTDGTAGVTSGSTAGGTTDGGTNGGATAGATTDGSTAGATDGSTAGTGSTAGSAGSTAGTAGTTSGSSVAQVTGLPSTGSGESASEFVWPLVAAGSVLMLLAGHFVLGTVKQRSR